MTNENMNWPFTFKDVDYGDYAISNFFDVEFKEDFGKIKAGKYQVCTICFESGFISVQNEIEDGTDWFGEEKFTITPIK